jgi:tripartite-type tricarboxylate transporter receptor subunit TctC
MKFRSFTTAIAAALLAVATPAGAQADWPAKPLKIIVPSAAGGAADFVARTFGRYLEQQLKQPVVIDNRAGAGGVVGTEAAKNAPADGYTFLLSTNSTHAANPSLFEKLSYDPLKDFDMIGLFGTYPAIGMVKQGSPWRSIPDLVQQAKANPGKVTFGYYSSSSDDKSKRIYTHILRRKANE